MHRTIADWWKLTLEEGSLVARSRELLFALVLSEHANGSATILVLASAVITTSTTTAATTKYRLLVLLKQHAHTHTQYIYIYDLQCSPGTSVATSRGRRNQSPFRLLLLLCFCCGPDWIRHPLLLRTCPMDPLLLSRCCCRRGGRLSAPPCWPLPLPPPGPPAPRYPPRPPRPRCSPLRGLPNESGRFSLFAKINVNQMIN